MVFQGRQLGQLVLDGLEQELGHLQAGWRHVVETGECQLWVTPRHDGVQRKVDDSKKNEGVCEWRNEVHATQQQEKGRLG